VYCSQYEHARLEPLLVSWHAPQLEAEHTFGNGGGGEGVSGGGEGPGGGGDGGGGKSEKYGEQSVESYTGPTYESASHEQ